MRFAVLLLAMGLPTLLTWLYFVVLAEGSEANPVQQSVYAFGKIFQFALPLLDWWFWDRRRPSARLLAPVGLGVGVGFGLLVLALGLTLYFGLLAGSPLFADTVEPARLKVAQLGVSTAMAFFGLALFLSLVHSGLEEYYWRWYVFGRLSQQVPLTPALILSGLAFMSHHVILLAIFFPGRFWLMAVPLSLGVAVGGIFWAGLYHRTGSLLGPWLSHALVDAAIFIVAWDLIRPA